MNGVLHINLRVSQPPSKEHWNETNGRLLARWVCTDWLPTSKRFYAAREKQFSRKRRITRLTPFSSAGGPNGPTERAQIKHCLMEIDITLDGGGPILRTTRCLAVPWHAQKVIVRRDLAGEARGSGWTTNTIFYLGTERTAMNSPVPFLPVPQGRVGLRHALLYVGSPFLPTRRHPAHPIMSVLIIHPSLQTTTCHHTYIVWYEVL